jgi:hypothetical protein
VRVHREEVGSSSVHTANDEVRANVALVAGVS